MRKKVGKVGKKSAVVKPLRIAKKLAVGDREARDFSKKSVRKNSMSKSRRIEKRHKKQAKLTKWVLLRELFHGYPMGLKHSKKRRTEEDGEVAGGVLSLLGEEVFSALMIFKKNLHLAAYYILDGVDLPYLPLQTKLGSHVFGFSRRSEDFLRLGLEQMFEGEMPFQVSLSLLPSKIKMENGEVELVRYIPLRDGNGVLNGIAMLLSNSRSETVAKSKFEEESAHNSQLVNILRNKDSFIAFVSDFYEQLQVLRKTNDPSHIKMILHTLKGNSAAFGLDRCARTLDEIESQAALVPDNEYLLSESREYVGLIEDEIVLFLRDNYDNLGVNFQKYPEKIYLERSLIDHVFKITESLSPEVAAEIKELFSFAEDKPLNIVSAYYSNAVDNLSRRLGKEIKLDLSGLEVQVDYSRFESVLKNIVHVIRNSCDHGIEDAKTRISSGKSEFGTIGVKFSIDDSSKSFVIDISDDGRGLDLDKLRQKLTENGYKDAGLIPEGELVMQIFSESLSTAEEVSDISGRGIGLSALKREVEELGGRINVSTKKGKGMRMLMTLPLEEEVQLRGDLSMPLDINVLVCEDEEDLAEFYRILLDKKGYRTHVYHNGMEGLLAISRDKFDLAIVDLNMPSLQGTDIIERLRSFSGSHEKIPAIVISGFLNKEVIATLSEYNDVLIMEKPVTAQEFLEAVDNCINSRQNYERAS